MCTTEILPSTSNSPSQRKSEEFPRCQRLLLRPPLAPHLRLHSRVPLSSPHPSLSPPTSGIHLLSLHAANIRAASVPPSLCLSFPPCLRFITHHFSLPLLLRSVKPSQEIFRVNSQAVKSNKVHTRAKSAPVSGLRCARSQLLFYTELIDNFDEASAGTEDREVTFTLDIDAKVRKGSALLDHPAPPLRWERSPFHIFIWTNHSSCVASRLIPHVTV